MISASFSRRAALLAALASSLLIAACGGKGGDGEGGTATVRALNLAGDIPSVDVLSGSTPRFTGQLANALSSSISLEAGTHTINLRRAGDATTLFTGSYDLAKDKHYTAVVWGRANSLRLSTLPEDETTTIEEGNARVRVFNATTDTGSLDIYLTEAGANLGEATTTQGVLPSGALSGFRDITAKTYRLRITGEKNPNDVRLDIPAITFEPKKHSTLVITAGAGGVLVSATLIVQQGSVTSLRNGKARVRLAAGVNDSASVSATVGGVTVSGAVASPRVGGYVLVDAGTADLTVRVNGAINSTAAQTFAEGGDYTVLAYGTAAAAQITLLSDDNRLPTTSTRAKVRLVHGLDGAGPLTLSLDYQPLQPSDIAIGTASTYYAADSLNSTRIEISSLTATQSLFTQTSTTADKLVQSQGVYTVFMLGGQATPTGVFRRDR